MLEYTLHSDFSELPQYQYGKKMFAYDCYINTFLVFGGILALMRQMLYVMNTVCGLKAYNVLTFLDPFRNKSGKPQSIRTKVGIHAQLKG